MSGVDPKPIRLVYCDDEGKLRMGEEAISILKRLEGPLVVVSVCGPTKDGKSFFCNQLQGRSTGFKLGPLPHIKCTIGLWMWDTLSKTTAAADGTQYNLLVIDMEGINGCAQLEQYYYLALVLSSVLIYNEMNSADTRSIYPLSRLTKVTDNIVGETTATELEGHIFPIFVWILRDWHTDGIRRNPTECVESFFKPEDVPTGLWSEGISDFIRFDNKVRASLQAAFPNKNRYCFPLVRPMFDEKDLWHLNLVSMDRLNPVFQKQMGDVKKFVYEETTPKKIGETVMTGPKFVQITLYILEAFNKGKLPSMSYIWKEFGKTNCAEASPSATTATVVATPPAVITRKRSIQQMM